jgi:NAD+ synthetase
MDETGTAPPSPALRYNPGMKVALAQINPTVGDIEGNLAKACAAARRAREERVDLVVLPELTLLGYPPRDLLLREHIIHRCEEAVELFAQACTGVAGVVGAVTRNDSGSGLPLYNSAVLCAAGRVIARHHKCLLPNYDVFDERRYFQPAEAVAAASIPISRDHQLRIGLTICEDLWNDRAFAQHSLYALNPLELLARDGIELVTNISASPFWVGKQEQRERIFKHQADRCRAAVVLTNQVGGNDELVFDGASMVIAPDGRILARARSFHEDFLVVDLDDPRSGRVESYPDELDSLLGALILGLGDYVRKCGFDHVVLGLSGGIDSALTAVLAAKAIGPARVHGVAMPSRYSSSASLEDARLLASRLGIDFRVIPIERMHEAAETTLEPHFGDRAPDATEENLQARIRGQILMSLSNKFGWLLLTTGNKSELAVGYCTLYGDMCGGLAVLSDVAKTTVYRLAERLNKSASEIIPRRILTRPPSAELRPEQTDQDTLPPYEVLDEILARYVERHEDLPTIVAAGFDAGTVADVIGRVDRNEYKRRQSPPGLKVTARAFGVGWRMPIAALCTTDGSLQMRDL